MRSTLLAAIAAISLSGAALAQNAAPPAGAPSMNKADLSKSCSQQADAKGLHGKLRKRFRSQCKHGH